MKDLISIIVPCYNAEDYLNRCLDSLVRQTYQNIEIICINDGSKDTTLSILQSYANEDSRVHILTSENMGPAHARNMGLKYANGQFLMFCDSDDWYSNEMCEKMHVTLLKENTDLVVCGSKIHSETNNKKLCDIKTDAVRVRMIGHRILDNKMRKYVNVFLWNKIFKNEIVKKMVISFPEGCEYDDCSFVQQYICAIKKYYGIEEKLYEHVVRDNSITDLEHKNERPNRRFEHIATYQHTLNFLIRNGLQYSRASYFLYVFFWNVKFFDWQFFVNKDEKKTALLHMKKILKKYTIHETFCFSNIYMLCIRLGIFAPVILSFDNAWKKKRG